jgi:putative DNA primase/helicase
MTQDGLYYHEPEKDEHGGKRTWICSRFQVVGHTANAAGLACGLAIRFHKGDVEHEVIVPAETLHKEARFLAATLADMGFKIETGRKQRDLLQVALNHFHADRNLVSVRTTGWHRTAKGNWVFVLSDKTVFGHDSDVILQSDSASSCKVAGTMTEWQQGLAQYAVGNSRLSMFLCAAFVAPLLEIAAAESGGVHLYGRSRDGKTTALALASSVWGRGDQFGYVRSWETTSNALEFVASASCDCLLSLDEIQPAPAVQIQGIVYKILNGSGKLRGKPSGGFREAEKWRTHMLSTGETTPAQRIAETGAQVMAGIDVRLVNVASDAGREMGVFEDLHGFASPADLAGHVLRTAKKIHGTPIREFLTQLVRARNDDEIGLTEAIKDATAGFARKHVPSSANGQVISVAGRFALIAFAGNLAKAFGILPAAIDADQAAGRCFKVWLEERGDVVASEDITVVRQVRRFIQKHADARFKGTDEGNYAPIIHNIAGYKTERQGAMTYYILPDQMPEIVPGMTPKAVAKILKAAGCLKLGPGGRPKIARTFFGQPCQVFELTPKLLEDSETD